MSTLGMIGLGVVFIVILGTYGVMCWHAGCVHAKHHRDAVTQAAVVTILWEELLKGPANSWEARVSADKSFSLIPMRSPLTSSGHQPPWINQAARRVVEQTSRPL